MNYNELKSLVDELQFKNRLCGSIPIWEINKYIENSLADSIYISRNLFKELTYQTNKHMINNNFEKLLYSISANNLNVDMAIIILKKLLGGFDVRTNKFYCIDGREISVNIIEDAEYCADIFLLKDKCIVGYIDTYLTYH